MLLLVLGYCREGNIQSLDIFANVAELQYAPLGYSGKLNLSFFKKTILVERVVKYFELDTLSMESG